MIAFEKSISKDKIDFEVLLPAICWHDVWKSTRRQTRNLAILILEQQYDGLGSYLKFKKYVRKSDKGYDKAVIIAQIIKLHSDYSWILPLRLARYRFMRNSTELKILTDLDMLDGLTVRRIKSIADYYIKKGDTDPLLFRVAYFWVTRRIRNMNNTKLNFEYSTKRFNEMKEVALKQMVKIFYELLSNKSYYFDVNGPNYKYMENFNPTSSDLKLIQKYAES